MCDIFSFFEFRVRTCFFFIEKYFYSVTLIHSNKIRTHNPLVRKQILNHLAKFNAASLAKWLSVRLQTKWSRVRVSLLSLKPQIWYLLRARSFLTFRQTIECGFSLKLVRDMIITYSQMHRTDKCSQHSSIKWLWVRISLLSLKPQIWRLLRARVSLKFRQTIECWLM